MGADNIRAATLSARNAKRPRVGRFAFLVVTTGMRTHRFDNFVWNKIGQPQAGPVARSAEG